MNSEDWKIENTAKRTRFAVLLCLLVCVFVQPSYAADKWLSVRFKDFLVIGNANEPDIRRAGRYLEEFRSAFAMMFPKVEQTSSVPATVVVFKNDESFAAYKPVYDGKPVNAVAYFQPGEDVNYIAVSQPLSSPSVIFHEYVHFLTREGASALPIWAREGLAEFYSTFEMNGRQNEFTLGRAQETHISTLSEKPFLPLKTLFAVDSSSPHYNEAAKQGIFYAESWALTHYLILGAEGKRRSQFVQFLTSLGKGDPAEDSFAEAFQTDYGTLEDELRDYFRKRNTWPMLKVAARETIQVDARSLKTTTLTEAESEYYLGDLLLHINRLAEAEPHLKSAISKDPNLIPAQASFGILRVRQRNYDEAVTLLKKAVESDAKSHITNFYYAYVLERFENEGATADASDPGTRYEMMRTYAKKSIELAPRFVEAYALLGRVNLQAGENLDESEALLKKAMSVAPGRHDLHVLLAQTYLRLDRTADARALLSNLERIASDPEIRRRATALLDRTEPAQAVFTEILPEKPAESAKEQSAGSRQPLPPPLPSSERETVLEPVTPVGPAVQGEKVTGLLILLECTNGLTLRVRSDKGTADFHSSEPSKIQFLSYTADVSDNIACGPRNPGTPVSITYQPVAGGPGEPLVVEFLEKR
jgi:tetratricopeptide (TPR) repeat protein